MTEFWKMHSRQATVEEMMLDSHAQELTQQELPEILSLLPSLASQRILELGAGIGSVAHHVTGVGCVCVCVCVCGEVEGCV